MEAVRTCIGCRASASRSSLLRVIASHGAVVADHSATLPGRGAWLHPTTTCFESAIKRRAFARALKVEPPLDTGALLSVLAEYEAGHQPMSPNEQAD
ncbi:YlxR family protein [Salinibacterium sp. NSLL150]|uniref:YlxR family protein n=1 Tax=unclassified Salinibacterium TaxID=2632331 RepID=UPI0018CFE684|nr:MULTISPECIES: YlxR family protein [unclassified Salinibacterium]MBH0025251.1 YlxR family protein [Salinibacterium sp. SWN248]MBH0055223.1 YlxR family protein [Salinibacterium sp. SWN139]MBH0084482.1 YlxR family protein [Salinibacterium sp. SWN167]MBH0100146.1 YlxR family protein [Salinibacterium sp. NSLL35]MBH0102900.1 YlxR family protein [Salinibacterium sp. NSLL150]